MGKEESSVAHHWEERLDIVRQVCCPATSGINAITDAEFELFLYQARRTGLDPLTRQIHIVKRGGKATIQASIDGLRVVAERSKRYAGSDDAMFTGEMKWGDKMVPKKATVVIRKYIAGAVVGEFSASARWEEYVPGPGNDFMWKKMPYVMLAKCAEALALRKAFPQDLSGVYSDDEMMQADSKDEVEVKPKAKEKPEPKPEEKAPEPKPDIPPKPDAPEEKPRDQRPVGTPEARLPRNLKHPQVTDQDKVHCSAYLKSIGCTRADWLEIDRLCQTVHKDEVDPAYLCLLAHKMGLETPEQVLELASDPFALE